MPATSSERCPGFARGISRSPPKLVVARPASAVREAYRRGATGAFGATGGSAPSAADAPPASGPDSSAGWTRGRRSSQRFGEARQLALHSLRDGDRGSPGASPTLTDKDD